MKMYYERPKRGNGVPLVPTHASTQSITGQHLVFLCTTKRSLLMHVTLFLALWEQRHSTNETCQPHAANQVAECSTYVH